MTTPLTIVLNKGRVLEEVLPLLARVGIEPGVDPKTSRQLVLATKDASVRLVIARGQDVPVFVGRGVADLGVTGKDILLEADTGNFYEPLDLGIACCRLVRAAPEGAFTDPASPILVATKYEVCARRFYTEIGQQSEIIKLHGAMEIAPLLGLADEIVDIVDTGNTLRAHGLVERDTIAKISARVIVNKAAMKRRFKAISELLGAMREVVSSG